MMDNQDTNIRKICRTCQSDADDMELIFENRENYDENLRIDEMLMECTSLQVNKNLCISLHYIRHTCLFRFCKIFLLQNKCY